MIFFLFIARFVKGNNYIFFFYEPGQAYQPPLFELHMIIIITISVTKMPCFSFYLQLKKDSRSESESSTDDDTTASEDAAESPQKRRMVPRQRSKGVKDNSF